MNFILVTGPPAVGKMTVGQELSKRLDYRLFLNHHSIELALNFFHFGDEEFRKINNGVRELIFKTCAESKNLKGLIFTLVWAFDHQEDWDYVNNLKKLFTSNIWNFYIVELYAPIDVRLKRNKTANRLEQKPSKRDIEKSVQNLKELEKKYQMNTNGEKIKGDNYLWIDNSNLSSEAVANQVMKHFSGLIDS